MSADLALFILAVVCFVLAAFNVPRLRWEWAGVALLVLTLIV